MHFAHLESVHFAEFLHQHPKPFNIPAYTTYVQVICTRHADLCLPVVLSGVHRTMLMPSTTGGNGTRLYRVLIQKPSPQDYACLCSKSNTSTWMV